MCHFQGLHWSKWNALNVVINVLHVHNIDTQYMISETPFNLVIEWFCGAEQLVLQKHIDICFVGGTVWKFTSDFLFVML